MGPPSYMRPVVDRNFVIRRIPAFYITNHTFLQKLAVGESALFHCIREIPAFGDRCKCPSFGLVYLHVDVASHDTASREFVLRRLCNSSCANILTFVTAYVWHVRLGKYP